MGKLVDMFAWKKKDNKIADEHGEDLLPLDHQAYLMDTLENKEVETDFAKTMAINDKNKKRVEEERKKHNKKVVRSHRLKK